MFKKKVVHYAVHFNSIKTVKAQYFHEIPKISIELSYSLLYYILLQFKEFPPLLPENNEITDFFKASDQITHFEDSILPVAWVWCQDSNSEC